MENLMSTIESLFRCQKCGNVRQYGCAGSVDQIPDLTKVLIRCEICGRTTSQAFVKNAHRDHNRTVEVNNQLLDHELKAG